MFEDGVTMKVKIQKLDEPNKNGVVYTSEEMERAIKDREQPVLGQFGALEDGLVNLTKVTHQFSNLAVEDGWLVGELKVLSTPFGPTLQQLMDANDISFRVSGVGRVDDSGVVSDLKLISVSAVLKEDAA